LMSISDISGTLCISPSIANTTSAKAVR
jgi:hypothetical protein